MNANFYLPVLKTKQGEFDGLSKLSQETRNLVIPLFEVTPLEWDYATGQTPKTIEEHLIGICKKFIKKWPNSTSFIDTDLVKHELPGGMASITFMLQNLTAIGLDCIPVVRIDSPDQLVKAIENDFSVYYSEIGIRVLISDVTSPEFPEQIENLLSKLKVKANDCHLIFDLVAADFSNINDFSDGIISTLDGFPNLQEWKTFTVCGGAFPETSMIKTGINYVPRNDWKFFQELIRKLNTEEFSRKINYGDYSIVAPGYFEFDPTKMSRSAHIRYTADDIWYVLKGKALKDSEDFQQYVQQATQIVNSAYYLGPPFSDGDLHLKNCSDGLTNTGNPTVWKRVGHNHHITKVVSDLIANSLVV